MVYCVPTRVISPVEGTSAGEQKDLSQKMTAAGAERKKLGCIQIETVSDLEGGLMSTQRLDYCAPQRGTSWKPGSQRYQQRRDYQSEDSTGERRLN